ncbi:hypothetical protein ACULLL_12545 [Lysinibacillus irui]|uniref:hypothetical protein n=1 Tax=Lysinibacillus irui TaxID=2998077 RepID=UPI0040441C57
MKQFRVRKWLKLHPEQAIIITSEHYKRLGEIGLVKIIIVGSYKDKIISFDSRLFDVMSQNLTLDSTSLSNLYRDFTQYFRKSYLNNNKKPTHYI